MIGRSAFDWPGRQAIAQLVATPPLAASAERSSDHCGRDSRGRLPRWRRRHRRAGRWSSQPLAGPSTAVQLGSERVRARGTTAAPAPSRSRARRHCDSRGHPQGRTAAARFDQRRRRVAQRGRVRRGASPRGRAASRAPTRIDHVLLLVARRPCHPCGRIHRGAGDCSADRRGVGHVAAPPRGGGNRRRACRSAAR